LLARWLWLSTAPQRLHGGPPHGGELAAAVVVSALALSRAAVRRGCASPRRTSPRAPLAKRQQGAPRHRRGRSRLSSSSTRCAGTARASGIGTNGAAVTRRASAPLVCARRHRRSNVAPCSRSVKGLRPLRGACGALDRRSARRQSTSAATATGWLLRWAERNGGG
jgi:hypothetical protein